MNSQSGSRRQNGKAPLPPSSRHLQVSRDRKSKIIVYCYMHGPEINTQCQADCKDRSPSHSYQTIDPERNTRFEP